MPSYDDKGDKDPKYQVLVVDGKIHISSSYTDRMDHNATLIGGFAGLSDILSTNTGVKSMIFATSSIPRTKEDWDIILTIISGSGINKITLDKPNQAQKDLLNSYPDDLQSTPNRYGIEIEIIEPFRRRSFTDEVEARRSLSRSSSDGSLVSDDGSDRGPGR